MGGTSHQDSQQSQQSSTNPWLPAQPTIQGILGQIQGGLNNTGVTGIENNALTTLQTNANNNANTYTPAVGGVVSNLLNGGNAMSYAPQVNQGYQDYVNRLTPTANGANIGPDGNPALRGYLDVAKTDAANAVNGLFAGSGRDASGMNQMALARGVTQAEAPILAGQYNTDYGNMVNAAGNIYNAGNTNAGILSGLQSAATNNQITGINAVPSVTSTQNEGANAALQAEAARRGIPVQALGLLSQIGIPIAGLGSQSQGTGNASGSNTMSGAQQFGLIANGIGAMMPKAPMSLGF